MVIKFCGCKHGPHSNDGTSARFQDQRYGAGMRVHTIRGSGKATREVLCTICGRNNGSSK